MYIYIHNKHGTRNQPLRSSPTICWHSLACFTQYGFSVAAAKSGPKLGADDPKTWMIPMQCHRSKHLAKKFWENHIPSCYSCSTITEIFLSTSCPANHQNMVYQCLLRFLTRSSPVHVGFFGEETALYKKNPKPARAGPSLGPPPFLSRPGGATRPALRRQTCLQNPRTKSHGIHVWYSYGHLSVISTYNPI